jgi:hypothetical protein
LEKQNAALISLDSLLGVEGEGIERHWKEILRDCIEFIGELGSGAFGEVKRGKLTDGEESTICAVKMLKGKIILITKDQNGHN